MLFLFDYFFGWAGGRGRCCILTQPIFRGDFCRPLSYANINKFLNRKVWANNDRSARSGDQLGQDLMGSIYEEMINHIGQSLKFEPRHEKTVF